MAVLGQYNLGLTMGKGFSGICGQRRPRPDCADAQSGLGLCCPLTEVMDTKEYMDELHGSSG